MLKQTVQDAINEQINNELYSAYVYLSMTAYCESINLRGFAHWMRLQAQEEVGHAMRLFDYVNDRSGRVMLKAIDGPPTEFKSPLDVVQQTYEHEQKVTGLIEQLYEVAAKPRLCVGPTTVDTPPVVSPAGYNSLPGTSELPFSL
jgi:ferritin